MATSLYFFSSTEEFAAYVEEESAVAKEILLSHMHRLAEARKEYDHFAGGKRQEARSPQRNVKQHEIEGFKVLVNPTPNYELSLLDEAIKSIQDRLDALARIKRILPKVKNNLRITAILQDGIPAALMYREAS